MWFYSQRFLDKSVPSLRKYMIQKSDDFSHWGRDHSHPWEPRFLSHIPSEVKHQTVWYLAPILVRGYSRPRDRRIVRQRNLRRDVHCNPNRHCSHHKWGEILTATACSFRRYMTRFIPAACSQQRHPRSDASLERC